MTTVWKLLSIKSVDPSTVQIVIADFVDSVKRKEYSKTFSKNLNADTVLLQLALFVRQSRQKQLDDALPYTTLDLSNFESQVRQ